MKKSRVMIFQALLPVILALMTGLPGSVLAQQTPPIRPMRRCAVVVTVNSNTATASKLMLQRKVSYAAGGWLTITGQ